MIFKARLHGLLGEVPSWMWEQTWTFSFLEDVFQNVSLQLGITYWFQQLTSDLSSLESADVLVVMNLNPKFCVLLRVNAFIWKQPGLMAVVYNMERGQHMNSGQFVVSGLKFWGICIVFFVQNTVNFQKCCLPVKITLKLRLQSIFLSFIPFFAAERRAIYCLGSFSVFWMV